MKKIINEYSKLNSSLWDGNTYNLSFKIKDLYDSYTDMEYICKPFNPNKGIAISLSNFNNDMLAFEFFSKGVELIDQLPTHIFNELMGTKHQTIIGFWANEGKVHLEYTLYFPNVKSPKVRQLIKFLKLYYNQVSVWDFAQQRELKEI